MATTDCWTGSYPSLHRPTICFNPNIQPLLLRSRVGFAEGGPDAGGAVGHKQCDVFEAALPEALEDPGPALFTLGGRIVDGEQSLVPVEINAHRHEHDAPLVIGAGAQIDPIGPEILELVCDRALALGFVLVVELLVHTRNRRR